TGFRPFGLRAYQVENPQAVGKSIKQLRVEHPEYRVASVERGTQLLGASEDIVLQRGDVVALGGRLESLTSNMGLLGAEVADARVLNIPFDQAEILVTNRASEGKPLKTFAGSELAGQIQITRLERGGAPQPIGLETKLQHRDVVYVVGLQAAVERAAALFGKLARHNSSTDLLTLAVGMILGLLIGLIEVPAFGATVGLGSAGGLLLSGIIVSSTSSRLRFFGNTPNAARNILEDMGLIVFVAIVGINAGASLLEQLSGAVALKIFVVGFLASTLPPFVVWAMGLYLFKINPALLMGATAGARSHSGPAREAAKEIDSSVPWIAFPVGYAISGVLLTVFGYVAMVLAK
ncbi:MAG: transporter, partial [Steroidobacteraceae bacterium]